MVTKYISFGPMMERQRARYRHYGSLGNSIPEPFPLRSSMPRIPPVIKYLQFNKTFKILIYKDFVFLWFFCVFTLLWFFLFNKSSMALSWYLGWYILHFIFIQLHHLSFSSSWIPIKKIFFAFLVIILCLCLFKVYL